MTIQTLTQSTISKIAAGQVVERPNSVVKELVENALDAGAKNITVELIRGGKDLIKVTDDGSGIMKKDLNLIFKRHSTSKITDADELFSLSTLGFRGEALASIAAIAEVELYTKHRKESIGHSVVQTKTKNLIKPHAATTGTIVEVKHIFSRVPARKKFLKSEKTELTHIIDTLNNYILSYVGVGFKLISNSKTVLSVHPDAQIKKRIETALGNYLLPYLLPIKGTHAGLNISGFLGTPQIARYTNSMQYLFVNGRPAKTLLMNKLIKNNYSQYLDPRMNPVFVLKVDADPSLIDVNISPKKDEVAFVYENSLVELVQKSVKSYIKKHDLTYQGVLTSKRLSDSSLAKELSSHQVWSPMTQTLVPEKAVIIDDLYFAVTTKKGIILIDQHAAHERVLYESFLKDYENKIKPKKLKNSIIFQIPKKQIYLALEKRELLQKAGFIYEEFGSNDFKLTHIPEVFSKSNPEDLILMLIQQIDSENTSTSKTIQTIANIACRYAIKKGLRLTPAEALALFAKLRGCKNSTVCPHGRPTHIVILSTEMDILFRRSVQK